MQRNFEFFRLRFPEKKRLRFFSLFVALSSLFWIITKLSNTYSSSIGFKVNFVDVPDLIVLDQNLDATIYADITDSGFDLLMYHFFINSIDVSLENADFSKGVAKIDLTDQKFTLQQQLFQSATLNNISPPNLTFSYGALKRKKIPVLPPQKMSFKPGYDRIGQWEIIPDSIWLYGLAQKVDSLQSLAIRPLLVDNIDDDISEQVELIPLDQIEFETEKVTVKASVKRFTEKSLEALVNIINLPDTLAIKLFPQSLNVTFLVLVDQAEGIQSGDFSFYCDFDEAQSNDQNTLEIKLKQEPKGVRNVRWTPMKVDYLIRK